MSVKVGDVVVVYSTRPYPKTWLGRLVWKIARRVWPGLLFTQQTRRIVQVSSQTSTITVDRPFDRGVA